MSGRFFKRPRRTQSTIRSNTLPSDRDPDILGTPGVPLFYQMPLIWAEQYPDAEMFNSRGTLGESVLYPIGPDALKDLFATNGYDFVKPTGTQEYLAHALGFGKGILTAEGNEHRELRRKMQPSFKINNIRALYADMWRKAGSLVRHMAEEAKAQGQVDVHRWTSKFGLDTVGVGALSREFQALEMDKFHPIAEAYAQALGSDRKTWRYFKTSIMLPQWVVRRIYPKHAKVVAQRARFLREQGRGIYDAAKTGLLTKQTGAQSILDGIIREPDLDRELVVDNILSLIAAGHESSAASISWTCHLLTLPENLKYQQSLREDLLEHLPPLNENTNWNLPPAVLRYIVEDSPLFNAICEESLRLFPPVPAAIRHATRQTTIAGTEIPKGTIVVAMPWAINRNPQYWGEDAEVFRPERWIDKTEDGALRANKHGGATSNFSVATFLHGPHACMGKDFNRAEMKCALAAIFSRFAVERSEGCGRDVHVTGHVTIKPKGGLSLELVPLK